MMVRCFGDSSMRSHFPRQGGRVSSQCSHCIVSWVMSQATVEARSADVELNFLALHVGAGRRRERHALGRKPHAGQGPKLVLRIPPGCVRMDRYLQRIIQLGRNGDEIEHHVRPPLEREADGSEECLFLRYLRG
jgi:hypothetical protein